MALIDDFKTRFPEFDAITVDQYVPILEPLWSCYWGGSYDEPCGKEIVLNLIAHLIVGETTAGTENIKSTQSKSVGSVSVSYSEGFAATSERIGWLNATRYGARYLMLTSRSAGGVFV
jgi:hypothetical protein